MKKLFIIGLLFLIAWVFAAPRADRIVIKNSYGYDSIGIFDDSVLADQGVGDYDTVVIADTSSWVDVQEARKVAYLWQLNTSAADSVTFQELVLCHDEVMGYMGSNDWYGTSTITDTITVVSTVFGRGMVELEVSACDSIAFVTTVLGTTVDNDTIHITKRLIKRIPQVK